MKKENLSKKLDAILKGRGAQHMTKNRYSYVLWLRADERDVYFCDDKSDANGFVRINVDHKGELISAYFYNYDDDVKQMDFVDSATYLKKFFKILEGGDNGTATNTK